jgi:hypothetical protein
MLGQASVDDVQHLSREFVLPQQVPEPQDGGLIGHTRSAFRPSSSCFMAVVVVPHESSGQSEHSAVMQNFPK